MADTFEVAKLEGAAWYEGEEALQVSKLTTGIYYNPPAGFDSSKLEFGLWLGGPLADPPPDPLSGIILRTREGIWEVTEYTTTTMTLEEIEIPKEIIHESND